MSFIVVLPILSGVIIAFAINYLSDFMTSGKLLSKPICSNPACKKFIPWNDYIFLRRCNYCAAPRGIRSYAVLLLAIISSIYLWFAHPMRSGFLFSLLVLAYLYTIVIIDMEHRLVLRTLSIVGLVLAAFAGCIENSWFRTMLGGLIGFAVMFTLYLFGKFLNHLRSRLLVLPTGVIEEALASGDVTLATILGLLIGWPNVWYGLLLSILFLGLISLFIITVLSIKRTYGKQIFKVSIPFGPAFILSTIVFVYLPYLI
jgi:Flp pilus assembly protein protease CpaA